MLCLWEYAAVVTHLVCRSDHHFFIANQVARSTHSSLLSRPLRRVLKDGVSTLKTFFHKVRLQEACFEDVIVIYRKSDLTLQTSELDILVGDGMVR